VRGFSRLHGKKSPEARGSKDARGKKGVRVRILDRWPPIHQKGGKQGNLHRRPHYNPTDVRCRRQQEKGGKTERAVKKRGVWGERETYGGAD